VELAGKYYFYRARKVASQTNRALGLRPVWQDSHRLFSDIVTIYALFTGALFLSVRGGERKEKKSRLCERRREKREKELL